MNRFNARLMDWDKVKELYDEVAEAYLKAYEATPKKYHNFAWEHGNDPGYQLESLSVKKHLLSVLLFDEDEHEKEDERIETIKRGMDAMRWKEENQ